VNHESLREAHKGQNQVVKFGDAIASIHAAGINVIASFVVGFDHDTLAEFDSIRALMHQTSLWYAHLNILDVLHGTELLERMKREGRWWGRPNEFSGGLFPVVHYNNFSQLQVFDKNFETIEKIFSPEDLYPRIRDLFSTGAFSRVRHNPDITVLKKFTLSLRILWWHLATRDPWKRRLFLMLVGLIRSKKLSIENAVVFVLTTEGIRRQVALLRRSLDRWRARIRAVDRGPWRDQSKPLPEAEPQRAATP